MSKKRTYLDSYVEYGFDFIVVDGVEKPQCLLCSKVLGNGSLKPSILIWKLHILPMHLMTVLHLRQRELGLGLQEHCPNLGFVSEKKPMFAASYHEAMRKAKAKKPHDIAEKLIKLCALDMVEHVCGNKEKQKI
ncbi:protein ZBED8-like [Limulus polyphemus]|uniref:Protein ZBED8-like n=1 Tax=Limulus polyphemus TaxID=6850 RepID=A0ABM1BYQ7_LIMPO|nr:protein ZBED8-like [Limulus polyphemus]